MPRSEIIFGFTPDDTQGTDPVSYVQGYIGVTPVPDETTFATFVKEVEYVKTSDA